MAAYEVLLLNTAVPQIQAAQSGDTYVVPRDIAFSAALTLSAGTANGVPYLNGSKVVTTGSALTFDGTTLGTTNVKLNSSGSVIDGGGNATMTPTSGGSLAITSNGSYTNGNIVYNALAAGGLHAWFINSSETMRLTTTGLGIGTNNPGYKLDVVGSTGTTTSGIYETSASGSSIAVYRLRTTGTGRGYWDIRTGNTASGLTGALDFFDNIAGSSRMTLDASGNLLVGTTTQLGSERFNATGSATSFIGQFVNSNASPQGFTTYYSGAAPNGTANYFYRAQDNAAVRVDIYSNGGIGNYQANDVNLSDQRVKKDIVPAPSYWSKIKDIEIVHFKYKDQTHDDNNVGVIAQQVEQVAPEFVNQDGWGQTPEDGVPLKSIYTSDMYHAAIKTLQEAMTRIETLEAEVAALKGA